MSGAWVSVGAAAAVVVVAAGCSHPDTVAPVTSESAAPGQSPRMAPPAPATLTPPTATVSLPRVTAPAPLPYPARELFADPVTVARAWMAQWCATDYREQRRWNIQRAAAFQTSAAAAADLAAGDTPDDLARAREQRLSRSCDQVTAAAVPSAWTSPTESVVVVTALRTEIVSGVSSSAPLRSVRRVVRDGAGRWLVDVAVAS
jgi:hypothetical protein